MELQTDAEEGSTTEKEGRQNITTQEGKAAL